MIVRPTEARLLLISQPDHAALSGRLMEAWTVDGLPDDPLRPSILMAVHEHDNGWLEEDAAPIVNPETGRPFCFISAPDAIRQRIWPRGVSRFAERNPLVAALIAEHALTVYGRYKADPAWRSFFEQIEGMRNVLLPKALPDLPADDPAAAIARLRALYRFVYIGDLLSLTFCNDWKQQQSASGYRVRLRGDRLEVTPDPFGGAEVPIEIRARVMQDRAYTSAADARREFDRGDEVVLTGCALGGSTADHPTPPTE